MTRPVGFSRMHGLTAVFLLSFPLATACGDASTAESTGATGSGGSTSSGSATGGSDATGAGGATGSGTAAGGGGSTGSGSTTVPTVIANAPLDGASDVPINGVASATFSEAMDGSQLTTASFTLTTGAVSVPGTVTYADTTAVFWPAVHLPSNATFIATITEAATSASGIPLDAAHTWSFTTGATVGPALPVNLGEAGKYVMLAKTGISTVPGSAVTGWLGLSPAAASYITGFSLVADATNVFSTSSQVTGKVFAADYAPPTPSLLTTAVGDMELAFTAAAARAPDVSELGAGDIGGMTLDAGVYRWGTGLSIPTDVALNGSATDVWVFQIAQDLIVADAVKISLTGGALAKNVFWQVAGLASLGTTAHMEGIILAQTSITLKTGASIHGRLMAQTAIGISGSTVVEPSP